MTQIQQRAWIPPTLAKSPKWSYRTFFNMKKLVHRVQGTAVLYDSSKQLQEKGGHNCYGRPGYTKRDDTRSLTLQMIPVLEAQSMSQWGNMLLLMEHTSHLHVQNFSYFSYFFELQHSYWFVPIIETMILLIIFLVSVVGNIGALILVVRERRLANNTSLTINLFLADLLFVSTVPFVIAVRWTKAWNLGSAACHLIMYFISVSGIVTIITLVAINIERLLAILKIETTPSLNPRWTQGVLLLIWFVSAVAVFPLSLLFRVIPVFSPQQVMTVPFVCFLYCPTKAWVHYSSLSLFIGRIAYMRPYMATFNRRDCVVRCLPCIRLPDTGL